MDPSSTQNKTRLVTYGIIIKVDSTFFLSIIDAWITRVSNKVQ